MTGHLGIAYLIPPILPILRKQDRRVVHRAVQHMEHRDSAFLRAIEDQVIAMNAPADAFGGAFMAIT